MTGHQRQGIGTWLAFFAMLMIYLGPLVSQSMSAGHAMPMLAGMQEMACSDGQRAATHSPDESAQHGFSADRFMEKCGYCGLLIHSPPLVPPMLPEPACPMAVGRSAPLVASLPVPDSPVFPGARSRAPPAMLA
ncbi:DUF2946 domain-containing protein [Pseudomonas jinjuensis]|nr:DUF2946 domain-containing protein [Pseudomonas jinjuensis]